MFSNFFIKFLEKKLVNSAKMRYSIKFMDMWRSSKNSASKKVMKMNV